MCLVLNFEIWVLSEREGKMWDLNREDCIGGDKMYWYNLGDQLLLNSIFDN